MGGTGPHIFALAALTLLCGCADPDIDERRVACAHSERLIPKLNSENGEHSVTLDVMTYNVEGMLSIPMLHHNREKDLTHILNSFNAMLGHHETPDTKAPKIKAPDILVVQEMFTHDAIRKLLTIRYPNFVYGPTREDGETTLQLPSQMGFALEAPKAMLHPSGLAIFSRYPITAYKKRAFGYVSCSGADCLANKGMVIAEIAIPGVPVPIRVATTHMNAQRASGTPKPAHLYAHRQQSEELADFLNDFDDQAPMIIAGDFNMKASPARFKSFTAEIPHKTAHHYCYQNPRKCSATIPLPPPAPWLTTQDLQFFKDGRVAKLHPVRLSHWFDSKQNGGKLSDHDAQRVTWKLRWPMHTQPMAGSCDYKGYRHSKR